MLFVIKMASLADLFNPSTFIILGIVALFIALVVVYFESKMREQNHKIASMLSLVSTLAEDMNGVKMGLNHLAITSANGGGNYVIPQSISQDLGLVEEEDNSPHLIEVSDDEDDDEYDDEESDEESVEQSENDDTEDEIEEDTEESDEDEPVKVIKLNISENVEESEHSYEETNNLEEDDLEVLEDMGDIPEISEEYTQEILSLKYDEVKEDQTDSNLLLEETAVPSASELKTISINLGDDSQSEHIEYKKLQLPKLRSITVEKGLATSSEVQKLKKPELLKLLGVE